MDQLTGYEAAVKARHKLLKHHPFFGQLAIGLSLKENPDIDTCRTDGKMLEYNPAFFEEIHRQYQTDGVVFCVGHEVGHCYLMHPLRGLNKQQPLYNLAGDFVINLMLHEAGIKPIPGSLLDEKFAGWSTNEVYDHLMKNAEEQPKQGHNGEQCTQPPQGSGTDGALTESDISQHETEIKMKIAEAAQIAKMQGKLPAHLQDEIDDILNAPEPWPHILREFFTNICHDNYTWLRGKRHHLHRGFYLPSLYNTRLGTVVVAIDTSGSCVGEFASFLMNLNSILEDCRPVEIICLYVDAAIAKVAEYTPEDLPIPNTLYGGGGTSFRPPFDWLERNGIDPDVMVYFTDTYGDFPDEEPDFPMIWAVTEGPERVPWGTVIEVTADA